jgi:GT2 family glycosyltransferase
VVDWRAGETWNNNISKNIEVFGVSGALPLFRRSALQMIVDKEGNVFDPVFSSYKEDVDLAFRLQQYGSTSWVVPDAVAYHDRSAAMPGKLGDTEALLNKQKQSEIVKYNSYRNHLYVLYKNEYWQNFIIDFPWIFWYELKKFVYFLLFDRVILGGLKDVLKQRKRLKKSRVVSKQLRKLTWDKMRVWWN